MLNAEPQKRDNRGYVIFAPKGRFCKECVVPTLMQKRNGVRGPFFGCANYPQCMYTENRGSMAMLGKPKWFDINAPR